MVDRRAAAGEAGLTGRVERAPECVVERAQPDLVADGDLLAGAHDPRAGTPLLGIDDRAQDPLEPGVETFDERVRVVQAAAVDAHDNLRPGCVERLALQLLDRLAANLAEEVAGAGPAFETGERGLVRGSPRENERGRRGGRRAPG